MNRQSHNSLVFGSRYSFLLICISVLIFSSALPVFAQDGKPEIINDLPQNLPVNVEIITPDKSEDYPEQIQIKVTNTGRKSIYAFWMVLDVVDEVEESPIAPDGKKAKYGWYSYDLKYGRRELTNSFGQTPTEKDVAIKPDEFYVFKVSKYYAGIIRKNIARKGHQQPRIYKLIFTDLSYGDGTGFLRDGKPFSKKN